MGLDLRADAPWLTTGVIKLGIFAFLILVALMIVNVFFPRWTRGILSAVVMLGGIYLFTLWLN